MCVGTGVWAAIPRECLGQDGQQHLGERGSALTFAGGSVKCAVLKASFACRREERSSGFAQVPQNSRPAGCPCLFSLVLRTSSQSSPKQEFNPEKCSLRSLLQHPLCPWQQGPSLTVQPILFLFFSLKGKLSNTANQGQEILPLPPASPTGLLSQGYL